PLLHYSPSSLLHYSPSPLSHYFLSPSPAHHNDRHSFLRPLRRLRHHWPSCWTVSRHLEPVHTLYHRPQPGPSDDPSSHYLPLPVAHARFLDAGRGRRYDTGQSPGTTGEGEEGREGREEEGEVAEGLKSPCIMIWSPC
ncbi:hypothetical protein BC936DRAFT_147778, partial [Jimgerdemannia flammicorona]